MQGKNNDVAISEKLQQGGGYFNSLHHGLDQLMHKITAFKKNTRDEPGNQANLLLCFLDNHENFQNVFSDLIGLKVSVHNLNTAFESVEKSSINVVSLLLLKNAYDGILNDLDEIRKSLINSSFYKNFIKDFSCQNLIRTSLAPSEVFSISNPKISDNSVKLDIKDQGIHEYLLENNSQKQEISAFNKTRKTNISCSESLESKPAINLQDPRTDNQKRSILYYKPAEEFLKPTVSILESRVSSKTPYLSLIAELSKQKRITSEQKIAIKNLTIQDSPDVMKAFKIFMETKNYDQLLKVLNILCPR